VLGAHRAGATKLILLWEIRKDVIGRALVDHESRRTCECTWILKNHGSRIEIFPRGFLILPRLKGFQLVDVANGG
jgi:hypothetical protein